MSLFEHLLLEKTQKNAFFSLFWALFLLVFLDRKVRENFDVFGAQKVSKKVTKKRVFLRFRVFSSKKRVFLSTKSSKFQSKFGLKKVSKKTRFFHFFEVQNAISRSKTRFRGSKNLTFLRSKTSKFTGKFGVQKTSFRSGFGLKT